MLSDLKNPVNNRKLGVVSSKKIYEYMNIWITVYKFGK
jgi:hypothetical protein